uniref:Uncharacterized protein n=1 Tax=Fervidicoccus fontis TaxID=683846 RepID=A0A7J3ZJC8_9CREN
MSERRLGHHVLRASKALSVVDKKAEVDEETFLSALEAVVMSRIIPVGVHPLHYLMAKREAVSTIIDKVKEFLSKKETATERLIELLGSMSPISASTLAEALEEMIENPVATAVFVRFLEQMLVSENAKEFIEYAKKIPGLYKTLKIISEYEKIFCPYL